MATQPKVLVVDDDKAIRTALEIQFKNESYVVYTAEHGEEGLHVAQTENPDIILLDIKMPKMDGMEMLQKLRELDEWGKNVPVILLTNLADTNRVAEAVELGVYDYLVKSDWKLDDVVRVVKEKLATNA
ncbi:MAG: response regulator [Patescibacteria group bacterium]